ncbi:MAG TPA: glycosyltransferase 87 family protein [Candidatus Thermoplasmatota archaeon]|nr:glycosyltransferase 87 family protein [Candidatus Thermoplasmatota archaeon]
MPRDAAIALPPPRTRLRRALPWAVVLLLTCLTLAGGFWLKEQCVNGSWQQPESWFCYSDMGILWGDRGFDKDRVPYLEEFNEYPPVIAAIQYTAALATSTHDAWIHANEAVLAVCALATAAALMAMTRPSWRPLAFALAPSLALYAFHNWDLAAVLLAVLGLLLFERGKPGWAGAALALGFYAKVYPALFLPVLGMALLREEHGLGRKGWRFGLASVGTLAAVAAPLLALAPQRFIETFAFHARRGPTAESMWTAVAYYAHKSHAEGLASFIEGSGFRLLSLALIVLALALFSWAAWRDRLHCMQACLGALVAFMLLNPVMSMQYALWLLPFLVLLRIPVWLLLAFFAADGWAYYAILDYFAHQDDAHLGAMAIASLGRAATHILLLAWVAFRIQRVPPAAVAAKDQPAPSSVPPPPEPASPGST